MRTAQRPSFWWSGTSPAMRTMASCENTRQSRPPWGASRGRWRTPSPHSPRCPPRRSPPRLRAARCVMISNCDESSIPHYHFAESSVISYNLLRFGDNTCWAQGADRRAGRGSTHPSAGHPPAGAPAAPDHPSRSSDRVNVSPDTGNAIRVKERNAAEAGAVDRSVAGRGEAGPQRPRSGMFLTHNGVVVHRRRSRCARASRAWARSNRSVLLRRPRGPGRRRMGGAHGVARASTTCARGSAGAHATWAIR